MVNIKGLSEEERMDIFINKWYKYMNEHIFSKEDLENYRADIRDLNLDFQKVATKMITLHNEDLINNKE